MAQLSLLIGTTNKGKFGEIREVLGSLPIKLITPIDLRITDSPVESGNDYETNAQIKARFYFEKSIENTKKSHNTDNIAVLAEDSGIEVDAFPGELGHFTRRWGAGENASDAEWLDYFLKKLSEKPPELHTARFICTACLIWEGKEYIFTGECPGKLLEKPQTPLTHGIPLSACFLPDGYKKVYSALTPQEKNTISHRGRAIHQVRDFIEKKL